MWCVRQYCKRGWRYHAADVADECFTNKKSAQDYVKQFEPFNKLCKNRVVKCASCGGLNGYVQTISGASAPKRRRRRAAR